MSAQAASIGSLISALLVSDHRILKLSWKTDFTQSLGWADLREPTYLAHQPWAARFPDHVFDSAWNSLFTRKNSNQGILLTALQALTEEFLELRNGTVRLRRDLLGAWQQGLVSRISSIPIQASADVLFGANNFLLGNPTSRRFFGISPDQATPSWRRQILPLLRPEEAPVADYVEREGLHETHLHLNGSTHAEVCWLRAIHNPKSEIRDFASAWSRGRNASHLHELLAQVSPDLTPHIFYQHLLTASRLRAWLVGAAENRVDPDAHLPTSCQSLFHLTNDEWSVGLRKLVPSWRNEPDIEKELTWMAQLIARLQQRPSVQLSRMFHSYLLLMNEHYRLLVQSEGQYGFDQFQKFTLTELREPAEREYRARFHAMHGPSSTTSTIGYLEGRFSPKDSPLKACRLFESILGGYLNYLCDISPIAAPPAKVPHSLTTILAQLDQHMERPMMRHRSIHRLTLVAHFIKQPWQSSAKHKAGPFRHYPLDLQLRRTTGVLLSVLARWPRLQTWVRGVDAAANELHAPPDVFAPTFRVCRRAGLTRQTYHAGEDFRHLLTGIAAIWEALTMLDLRHGDRIGHGTAMGIRPSLWLDRMPGTLTLSQGEWMLGVLAAWQLLRDTSETQACVSRLQRELEESARQIFGRTLAASEVEQAMALRGLSRRDLMQTMGRREPRQLDQMQCLIDEADTHHESLSEVWREESEMVRSTCQKQPQTVGLLWEWLSDERIQKRAEDLITKKADFLDAASYLRLQQALMKKVAERGVLIETLPSSNVRISQYHHIEEHHSLRWMRVPGHIEEGDPEIMVCLGSDDPGIFASDLETEFYLLYAALRKSDLSDSEALRRLSILNERGRIYRFHHPLLS